MRVRLLRDARISHKAGEIVEVSPTECAFLLEVGSAEEIKEKAAEPVSEPAKTEKKPAKKVIKKK